MYSVISVIVMSYIVIYIMYTVHLGSMQQTQVNYISKINEMHMSKYFMKLMRPRTHLVNNIGQLPNCQS